MGAGAQDPFVMHGSRSAMAGGFAHIEEQVKAIEEAVVENPHLAFDLAKVLVESTCRTVLGDRSVSYAEEDDLPKLFKSVSQNVSFLPSTANNAANARKSLARTLNGLSTTIQGICELRNECGFAAHGYGNPPPVMEVVQAHLAAAAADAIVGFIYRMHREDGSRERIVRFEENGEFNDHLDEVYGPFLVDDVEFRPSEVLYGFERETYRIYLAEFQGSVEPGRDSITEGEVR